MLFTLYDKLPENLNASALRPDCWQCPIHKTYSCWNFSDFNRKKMFLKTCGYASPLTYRRAQRPLWISWVVINWIKSRPPHTLLEYINMNARSLSSCFHFLLCHHFWGEDDHLESLQAPKLMWDWTLWLIFLVALYMFNVLNNLICYMFQFIHFASFFQCPTIFWWVWNIWCIPLQQQMIRDKPANQEEDVLS